MSPSGHEFVVQVNYYQMHTVCRDYLGRWLHSGEECTPWLRTHRLEMYMPFVRIKEEVDYKILLTHTLLRL